MSAERVLIVDHEAAVREMAAGTLTAAGFRCTSVASVAKACEQLQKSTFDLLISAVRMPGESEQDLLGQIARSDSKIAILMATVEEDPLIAHRLFEEGIDAYLVKPFTPNELLIQVDCALAQAQRRGRVQGIDDESLTAANQRAAEMRGRLLRAAAKDHLIDHQRLEMIGRLGEVIGIRDLESGAHVRRVGRYSELLARGPASTRRRFMR